MLAAVKASAARLSATEIDAGRSETQAPSFIKRLGSMHRVHRAYAAVRERVASLGGRGQQREEVRLGGG